MIYPGKNLPSEIKPDIKQYKALIKFIGTIYGPIADIGSVSLKTAYISENYHADISQINQFDFNFPVPYVGERFSTVLCFEVIEHIQNPLQFMQFVKSLIDPVTGTIYLSTPGRMPFMWSSRHFFEMTPSHFKKWICNPLDLVIVEHRRIPVKPDFNLGDIGIRPLLRMPFKLFNYTNAYKIKSKQV